MLLSLTYLITESYDWIKYNYNIKNFIKVETSDIKELVQSKIFFILYTGRVTCPWCKDIVPLLKKEADTKNIKVYYLDSQNTETDYDLKLFRQYYKIEFVPSVIIFSNGSYRVVEIDFDNLSIIL